MDETENPQDDPTNCRSCLGCGKIANDDDASPWTVWADMPPPSNIAMTMGLARPIPCPECGGTGKRTEKEAAE